LKITDFATVELADNYSLTTHGGAVPSLQHHVGGKWVSQTGGFTVVLSPLNGEPLFLYPKEVDQTIGFEPFIDGFKNCPKHGLHNPIKNPERYLMLGEVCFKAAVALQVPEIEDFFTRLIQCVMPKSYAQARGEVIVTRQFFKNFSGDNARFLCKGETTPGDHLGQESCIYHWPYGAVLIIAPFNFPLEIPALQLVGALLVGNRPTIKAATTVAVVLEQFLRLLFTCGLPESDVDLIHCSGWWMERLIDEEKSLIRHLQFTGSSSVANHLAAKMKGKIAVEDAGFDWKILGPDCDPCTIGWVAYQCDQDAFAASGQKCSAQSILFYHENWETILPALKDLAERRNLENLTNGPVLTWTTKEMLDHIEKLAAIPGAKILFGGRAIENPNIPKVYGLIEPTMVLVPIERVLGHFDLVCKEVFGPVTVAVKYGPYELDAVLEYCERMTEHLTAAVVSQDPQFINTVLGRTVNGTIYAGIRARTTGAPQNHWFGPAGDPRAAGIGTPEAIRRTWTSPRCVICDVGPIPDTIPEQS